jgi:hypothetical protein
MLAGTNTVQNLPGGSLDFPAGEDRDGVRGASGIVGGIRATAGAPIKDIEPRQKEDAYMSAGTTYTKTFRKTMFFIASLLVVSMTGCGGGGGGTPAMGGPAPPVNLGTTGDLKAAGSYVILVKTAITNTGTSAITGNINQPRRHEFHKGI